MPGNNDADEKKIAELTFGASKAELTLDTINKGLQEATELAKKANEQFSQMGKNVQISFGNVDTKSLEKQIQSASKEMQKLTANQIKNAQNVSAKSEIIDKQKQAKSKLQAQKTQDDLTKIAAKGEQQRLNEAQKQENKKELLYLKETQSAKTMYDKIQDYANKVILTRGLIEFKNAIRNIINEMVDVESAMIQIDRVLNESSLDINNYRDDLMQLAYDYGNSFENVADVTLRLAQAGFDSQESLALTEKTLLALNTAELDATEATDDMVAVMAQWGLMTGDAQEEAAQYASIIDKVNKVADNFPTTSADILDALKKMSSGFNLAGATIDETIATFVAAEKASQRGGKEIGNALNSIIQQLKSEKKLDIAESLGLDFYTDETKTEFKNIMEIFDEMSDRMQQLKANGKESSVEMQSLLELFTVFRRNVGASMLGEMGDISTYTDVIKTLESSMGYSLQENEKYMRSTAAAQEQLNTKILELKTKVWDNGTEGVYRDMLSLGNDLVGGIGGLIDEFGLLPTVISSATLAMGLFSNKMDASALKKYKAQLGDLDAAIVLYNKEVKTGNSSLDDFNKLVGKDVPNSFKKYLEGVNKVNGSAGLGGYISKTVLATAKQLALNVAVAAGEAALSLGLSLAIQGIVTGITKWINATEEAGNALQEMNSDLDSDIKSLNDYASQFESIRKQMDSGKLTQEEFNSKKRDLITIQEELIKKYGSEAKGIDLVTGSIEQQSKAITNLAKQDYKKYIQENQKEINKLADTFQKDFSKKLTFYVPTTSMTDSIKDFSTEMKSILNELGSTGSFSQDLKTMNINFEGTVEEVVDKYRQLYDKIEEYRNKANEADSRRATILLEQVSNTIDSLDNKYSENLKTYKEYLQNKFQYDTEYSTVYEKTLKARAELSEAIIKGDKDAIAKASENLTKVYNEAIEKAKDDPTVADSMVKMLQGQLEDLQDTVEKEDLNVKLGIKIEEDSDSTVKEEIQKVLTEMGDISSEDLKIALKADESTESISKLKEILSDANIDIDTFINLFDTLGFTLGNTNEKVKEGTDDLKTLSDNVSNAIDALANLESGFTTVYNAMAEFNSTGAISASTLKSLVDNNLIQYLDIVDGKLAINEAAMANAATAAKAKAIEDLQAEAAARIAAIAFAEEGTKASEAGGTTATLTTRTNEVKNALIQITPKILEGADAWNQYMKAMGASTEGLSEDATNQIKSIVNTLGTSIRTINNMKIQAVSYSRSSARSSGGSRSSGSSSSAAANQAKREAEQAEKEAQRVAEELYKKNLALYTDYVKERERLEKRWVDKQKELGQLTNKDFLYITQQRIQRYQVYLDELKKLTWINEEDRVKLEKEYTEEIEDLQLDYLGYLKDILDDEIDAVEKSKDEKIKAVEDEADARIAALKKVEAENDRIRSKEEYESKKREIQEQIDYWSQRTGREAQTQLLEAQKQMQELDKDWQETLEDWDLDDQIQAIEDARDKEVATIEDAAQKEIDELQRVYDEKVKLFSETGQIIYQNGVIEATHLYNAYKEKFVDPIKADLESIRVKTANTTPKTEATTTKVSKPQQQYETYTIKWGDTLSGIASKYGTTVQKLMDANPYITNKNKIYAGKSLQIPKFHEGGETTGTKEGYALLKPKEIILKPDWATGMKKLIKMVDKGDFSTNSSTINVKGDLVKVDAKIDSKQDVDYFAKKVKKVLASEFNIKK